MRFTVAQGTKPPCSRALRQIVVNRIPVEVGPFCDTVERLCGLFIMADRFKRHRSLHDVTLPYSWFISLSRSLPTLDKDTSYLPRFVNGTIELLGHLNRRLDFQREHPNPQPTENHKFTYNGLSLGPMHTPMYIARMSVTLTCLSPPKLTIVGSCFCLCLRESLGVGVALIF